MRISAATCFSAETKGFQFETATPSGPADDAIAEVAQPSYLDNARA